MLSALLNQNMWAPAVSPNGTIIPSLSSKRIKSGNFSHVPLIGGSNVCHPSRIHVRDLWY